MTEFVIGDRVLVSSTGADGQIVELGLRTVVVAFPGGGQIICRPVDLEIVNDSAQVDRDVAPNTVSAKAPAVAQSQPASNGSSWAHPLMPSAPQAPYAASEIPSAFQLADLIREQLALGYTVQFEAGPEGRVICNLSSYQMEGEDWMQGQGASPLAAIRDAIAPKPATGEGDDAPW